MPLPSLPSPASLPLRPGPRVPDTPGQHSRAYDAAFAPEYSLLICGRPRAVTADSTLEWDLGPLRNPHVRNAVLDVAGFPAHPITLFHYIAPFGSPAGALRECCAPRLSPRR